ncbi:hypothetical protein NMY22_g9595 [Coprinellus aureogranulatus]|nr:hypothetical protein NMY22_g9595 [Coprinellus aureogranulatus]
MGQHQIAVHTWSHTPLTTQTNDEIIAELGWSKKIIKDVLGVTPNMMRPPFGDIDDRVRAISHAMGLTPVIWTRNSPTSTFDTDDFNIHNGVTPVQKVLQNWQNILSSASTLNHGFIVLEHDLFQESVEVATGYILPDALAHNPPFKIRPVVECLGHPLGNAYIETNDNNANPPPNGSSGSPSTSTTGHATKSSAGRQYPLATMNALLAVILACASSLILLPFRLLLLCFYYPLAPRTLPARTSLYILLYYSTAVDFFSL